MHFCSFVNIQRNMPLQGPKSCPFRHEHCYFILPSKCYNGSDGYRKTRPLLFLTYVNDIADSLLSLTRLFADDSSLFYSTSSILDLQGIFNHVLQILSACAKQWLVNFNTLKTEGILFTLKRMFNLPKIFFDGIRTNFVSDHKHLGLTLNNKGRWG